MIDSKMTDAASGQHKGTTSTEYAATATGEDLEERARRILGRNHADAGCPGGDLAAALDSVEAALEAIEAARVCIDTLRRHASMNRWTMRKTLDLLDCGNIEHARRTLAHSLRLDAGPVYGDEE